MRAQEALEAHAEDPRGEEASEDAAAVAEAEAAEAADAEAEAEAQMGAVLGTASGVAPGAYAELGDAPDTTRQLGEALHAIRACNGAPAWVATRRTDEAIGALRRDDTAAAHALLASPSSSLPRLQLLRRALATTLGALRGCALVAALLAPPHIQDGRGPPPKPQVTTLGLRLDCVWLRLVPSDCF